MPIATFIPIDTASLIARPTALQISRPMATSTKKRGQFAKFTTTTIKQAKKS